MKLQLQVGKTYVTSNGFEVTIIEENTERFYPFKGDNGLEYTEFGTYFRVGDRGLDLVKEVNTEPKSVVIPDNLIEKLKSLAQQETWRRYSTYADGASFGRSSVARQILDELGISWDK